MPTYEYACQSCGHHVEVYQRFTDAPLTVCEICGGPLRKVFHPAGILFKGSGFYSTDSRKAAARSNGSGESGSTSKGEGSKGEGSRGEGSKGEDSTTKATPSKDSAKTSSSVPASGSKERSA